MLDVLLYRGMVLRQVVSINTDMSIDRARELRKRGISIQIRMQDDARAAAQKSTPS